MLVAAHQPLFIPWIGYFDKISKADIFVIVDNVQFTSSGWIRRNAIKGSSRTQTLVVPVARMKERLGQLISEVQIDKNDKKWKKNHLHTFQLNYGRAPFYKEIFENIKAIYNDPIENLDQLNIAFIRFMLNYLSIKTKIVLSSDLKICGHKTDLILDICKKTAADSFMLGMGGSLQYANRELIEAEGVKIILQNFVHPVYPQLFGDFVANLSTLDLLFNMGPASRELFVRSK